MPGPFVSGMPGLKAAVTSAHRTVFRGGQFEVYYAGGRVIDGTKTRDPDNTGAVTMLRAGLTMGKITSSGKWANSIIGGTGAAYASGTSLTLTSAVVTELIRRVGATGTFTIVGPPSASGVVMSETVTYSALNTSTFVATITALTNAYISGSLVQPTDGSQDIRSFLPDGYPIAVVGSDMVTAEDQPFAMIPIGGTLTTANIINYPSDASLKTWFRGQLARHGQGKFVFDDQY